MCHTPRRRASVTDMGEVTDLRSSRHANTRDALLQAAIELIGEHGYAAVTVEQIATAAGVSRRTAYRRFRTKDDILLELPRRWLEVFDDHVAAHPESSARARIEGASLAVSAHVDAHRNETLVGLAALAESPSLASATVASDAWLRRMVNLLVADGVTDTDARLIAGSYLGGIDAMLGIWSTADPPCTLVSLNERLDERLGSIWTP